MRKTRRSLCFLAALVMMLSILSIGAMVSAVESAVSSTNETEGTSDNNGSASDLPVASINGVSYATLEEAFAAAQAGDEIILLADVAEDITVPAGVVFNGNDKQVGAITAAGEITFKGHTKATNFSVMYTGTVINIGEGACLEITGTGRLVIGHGCTFNITGTVADAKTADVASLTPSLIAPGASITGTGVTFNVSNAYLKFTAYCSSKNSNANGTFNIDVTNSIWEQSGSLVFSEPTNGKDPTFNFNLKDSVLNSTSHLVFAVSKGEIVFDNSNVNVGTSRQIENRSTMTVKNGSVVNGAVATSSNAKNPGTLIIDNATYAVTGEFSGSDVGTGTIIVKNGASFTAGSVTKANIQIDATGMQAGDEVEITANLSKLAGTIEVINNNALEASILDGKIVLSEKPAAQIGDVKYATLAEAFAALKEGDTLTILAGEHSEGTIKMPATLKNVTIKGEDGAILKDMTVMACDGNSISYEGLTFDNIKFDNSRISITGWRTGGATVKNLTITNCVFVNLNDTTNSAPVHINVAENEAVYNFTFTNNTIDGATGGSKSGLYLQATGNVVIENNVINNVAFRPYVIQITTDDGIADNFTVTGNTFSGSAAGRAQGLGNNGEGTDTVNLVVSGNIFKGITSAQQICYWNFNAETTTADLSKNYYDIDIVANPSGIYYNGSASSAEDLVEMGIFPIYTALNEDGTIDESSEYTYVPAAVVAQVGEQTFATLADAVAYVKVNGGTIVILANVNESMTIADINGEIANKYPITIDLNGFTVTSGESTLWVSDGYVVTVKDSVGTGKIVTTSNDGGNSAEAIAVNRDGKVILEGGTIEAPYYGVYLYSGNTYGNEVFVMNGGKVIVPNGGQALSVGNGKATINGGEVICEKIAGGSGWNTYVYVNGVVEITGGNFYATIGNSGTISISGGTFSYPNDPNDGFRNEHLADGYGVKEVDGKFVVYALPTSLSGSGTAEDPFLINNIDDLKFFRDSVNNGNKYNGQYVKLNADIDLNNEEWTPIADMNVDKASFIGTFDGGNHTISNLKISSYNKNGAGFFGCTGSFLENEKAVIKNLTFNNVTIKSTSDYVGTVVANSRANTRIENVHVTGAIDISGRGYIGGISGHGYVVMDNVSVVGTGTISSSFWCAGGILGYAGEGSTNIMNAHVEGITITSAAGGLGAIVGMAEDNGGTQPISGSNLSATNVTIKTYVGAYGDAYANYGLGYLYGGNPTSKLTGNLSVNNVVIETSTGVAPNAVDAAAAIGDTVYFSLNSAIAALKDGDTLTIFAGEHSEGTIKFPASLKNVTIKGENGAILKDMTLMASDGSNISYEFITFDGIVFDNSNILFPGQRASAVFNNWTITNCEFKNVARGNAAISFNLKASEAMENFTFTNNVINGVTGGSYSGLVLRAAKGNIVISGNNISNVAWNAIQLINTTADTLTITGNTFASSADEGILNLYGVTATTLTIKENKFLVSEGQPGVCYITAADVSKNYWGGNAPANLPAGVTYTSYYADAELTQLITISYVAQIGDNKYTSLQDAENAAKDGDTIVLLDNITLTGSVTFYNAAGARMITLDMNGKTITIENDYKVFWICDGLTITGNGTFIAAPTYNGGIIDPNDTDWGYVFIVGQRKSGTTDGISGNLVIENGNFYSNDASVISVTNGSVTINDGTFEAAGDLDLNCIDDMYAAGKATITVKGGIFVGFNPENNASEGAKTNFCADGYVALKNLDGMYVVGKKPSATVNDLGGTTLPAGGYGVWDGKNYTQKGDVELPLSFVMQFLADQSAADAANSPYADWYGDFVITFDGIENGSFVADGCYLAGYYGDFGWVKVPVDGMTITNGVRYPVMLGVGLGQKYDYICSGVKDFQCALYITPDILAANPNLTVNLELSVVDNSKGQEKAAEVLENKDGAYSDFIYEVTENDYVAGDFVTEVPTLDFMGTSLVLGTNIQMNFYLDTENVYEGTKYYALITISNGESYAVPMDKWQQDATGRWFIPVAGLAAKQMNENISVELYRGVYGTDGAYSVSRQVSDCIKEYAMWTINYDKAATVEMKKLMVTMLNYGAAAQMKFGYDVETLANAGITAEQQATYGSDSVSYTDCYTNTNTGSVAYFAGDSLNLTDKIEINFYYRNLLNVASEDIEIVVSYTDYLGAAKSFTYTGADLESVTEGRMKFCFSEIVAADVSTVLTVTLKVDGNVVNIVTDSIESYCAFYKNESPELAEAIVRYASAAEAYFTTK